MDTACRLAGFVGAQALWHLSTGGPLTPTVAFESADGQRSMAPLDPTTTVDQAHDVQRANAGGHPVSALAHEAVLGLGEGPTPTLVLYIVDHAARRRIVLGVPYSQEGDFTVRTLQVLDLTSVTAGDLEPLIEAFFDGVEGHPHGKRLWGEHFDARG